MTDHPYRDPPTVELQGLTGVARISAALAAELAKNAPPATPAVPWTNTARAQAANRMAEVEGELRRMRLRRIGGATTRAYEIQQVIDRLLVAKAYIESTEASERKPPPPTVPQLPKGVILRAMPRPR